MIRVGTSGWSYWHWKGTFYPDELKASKQFEYFVQHFDTVELNSPFYRLPEIKTFQKWKEKVPEGFVYSVKANRWITHLKKLAEPEQTTEKFFLHIAALEEKLGPVLFQLPPGFQVNEERLEHFLNYIPKGLRYTFEFRNHSWYTDRVYDLLKSHHAAFCIYELEKHLSPLEVTADFIYIRLHGPTARKYTGSYSDSTLKQWAIRLLEWDAAGKDIFIYFDNDQLGYAAFNALRLKELLASAK